MPIPTPSVRFFAGLLAVLACALWPPAAAAERVELSGRVTLDDGSGAAGVQVSNGRELVATDADGRYRLPLHDGDTAFVIKPAGVRSVRHAGIDGRFWVHHRPQGSPALRYGGLPAQDARVSGGDFVLLADPAPPAQGVEVLVFGDPQPRSAREVSYYARDIVEPLVGRHGARLGLTLGDVVHDDLSLYPAMNAITARLGVPWLHAAGNHDLDFDAASDADSLLSFRAVYGPDTFAWEEPGVAFVVLDNVIHQPGASPAYIGGLRDDQFAFLQAYLATLPRDRLLVLAAHIPFFDPDPARETFRRADRERLFALLAGHPKLLLLTAHGHVQRHHRHGADDGWQGAAVLHEYNLGAACGAFWSGVADADGIPDATMADGTPNGFARLQVAPDGGWRLRWQVARGAQDDALRVTAPKVLRHGAYPAFGVYANVFMARADARVEFRIDGGDWQPMRRVAQPDPFVQGENLRDLWADTLRGDERAPEAVPSTHLWRGTLPTDLAPGAHRIEVRAQDPWGDWSQAARVYRLETRAP